ncbi:hypothetical protein Vadar_006042 [Vaccinium darrowii]|uniref:Uncharacterized protein n=1 Tax=Vaccinium darrowii TaxID=229202 RepID=A0ACB7YJI5_9ERIC|nr:hypothetical protein Vadar_006042 [Vaccinium darrowii]
MGFSSQKRSKFDFLLTNPFSRKPYDQSDNEQSESASLPSPSLVPVPVQFVVGSIKERLPVTKYGYGTQKEGCHECAICLKSMRKGDEVRELCNDCHMFHKECLDSWIDQGQMTCPLCRSNLSPSDQNGEESKCGGDPWRRERMMYLFGEDFVFQ